MRGDEEAGTPDPFPRLNGARTSGDAIPVVSDYPEQRRV